MTNTEQQNFEGWKNFNIGYSLFNILRFKISGIMHITSKFLSIIVFVFFIIFFYHSPATGQEDIKREGSFPASGEEESAFNPGAGLASIFRDYISPVDGDRCPSFPSCSSYSFQAFQKHGFFIGWVMTVDRLIHEGKEETSVSPLVLHGEKWKIYDPIENNDFWWFRKNE